MISRDHQDVRIELENRREEGVEFLDPLAFFCKISVFSIGVYLLHMKKEEIMGIVIRLQVVDLVLHSARDMGRTHSDEFREASVHRIRGYRYCVETVSLVE